MCGVLIYTASGDSEGSLGGLVRQGEPGRLEDTILAAIHNAEWCSSDPICIQSLGQGPESCNLADAITVHFFQKLLRNAAMSGLMWNGYW